MDGYTTPPRAAPGIQLATPTSIEMGSPKSITPVQGTPISPVLTPIRADSNSETKRLQQDLLILTSFNDNTTLHWRPTWFEQGPFAGKLWTLHNPSDVVTESSPSDCKGIQLFTRRMRRTDDLSPQYIKSWEHWMRYCHLYGIPYDFLCEEQVRLMRTGLWTSPDGSLCPPPSYPLYPEPSGQGRYVITPSVYSTKLPRKFQKTVSASPDSDLGNLEHVVVGYTGALAVEPQDKCSWYPNRGKWYRWSSIPWSTEMEESCRPLTVKLRLWNMEEGRKTEIIM